MEARIKNVVFLSSTGNGKSSACNFIVGERYFPVGERLDSCTATIYQKECPRHGINVIDTAGFSDTRFEESHIDALMAQLTSKVIRIDGSSTNQIDAFVLVIKCTPRAMTLKTDIDHILNIFG